MRTTIYRNRLAYALAAAFISLAGTPAFAAPAPAAAAAVHRIILSTGVVDGKMTFVDQAGKAVTTLKARTGETVEVQLTSGEGAEHDFQIPDLGVHSPHFSKDKPASVRFQLTRPGKFAYFCSVPGHRQIGMEGVLEVTGVATGTAVPAVHAQATAGLPHGMGHAMPPAEAPMAPAKVDAVSVSQDPTAVPVPVAHRAAELVKYRIETVELEGKLDDGTTFTYWTFNRKVPGPLLRVREGDTVELTLANDPASKMMHSIDLHAVTGGMGGGENTQVGPGQEKTIRFKARNPGLYVYHCATPLVPQHIASGMYGLILVEPKDGLPKVDREFYVMQADMYTRHPAGAKGHQEFDTERMADERPDYYVFNGAVGSLVHEHQMEAKVGETVRVYFGVGGPNKISSFHVIGQVFDKVYSEGSLDAIKHNVQTTLVAPGGATIVEFKVAYPGKYMLVDHALSRAAKGAVGVLQVSGDADPAVYQADSPADPHHTH